MGRRGDVRHVSSGALLAATGIAHRPGWAGGQPRPAGPGQRVGGAEHSGRRHPRVRHRLVAPARRQTAVAPSPNRGSAVTRVPRLCWLLPAVPFVYLAVILWLQPADHLGWGPDKAPWLGRLVYDDFDVTAYAVRGLNAHAGRTPGLEEEPSCYLATALDDPGRSLR